MTTETVELIVFVTLLVHGIGHFQGVIASLGVKINSSGSRGSWLLKALSEKSNQIISMILFSVTGILGILAGLSFMGILLPDSNWQILALFTAITSTICLILFPNGFAIFFNKVGAICVNLIIFYSILFNGNWPSVIFND